LGIDIERKAGGGKGFSQLSHTRKKGGAGAALDCGFGKREMGNSLGKTRRDKALLGDEGLTNDLGGSEGER